MGDPPPHCHSPISPFGELWLPCTVHTRFFRQVSERLRACEEEKQALEARLARAAADAASRVGGNGGDGGCGGDGDESKDFKVLHLKGNPTQQSQRSLIESLQAKVKALQLQLEATQMEMATRPTELPCPRGAAAVGGIAVVEGVSEAATVLELRAENSDLKERLRSAEILPDRLEKVMLDRAGGRGLVCRVARCTTTPRHDFKFARPLFCRRLSLSQGATQVEAAATSPL